jgi:hypothetical protein
MTRFSIAAALALLVLPGAAQAKIPVLDLGSICHFMPIVIDHARVNGFSHYDCETGNFVGLVGRVDGARWIIASIRVKHKGQFLLQLAYPLADGGAWSVFTTRDGYTMKLYKSGTYTVSK